MWCCSSFGVEWVGGCPETVVGKLDYSQRPSVSSDSALRARAAVRIAARKQEIAGFEKSGADTVVGKLDQPPVPSAPSARPGRAPRGGGCAARGADLRTGTRPKQCRNSRPPPPRAPHHPSPLPPVAAAVRLLRLLMDGLVPAAEATACTAEATACTAEAMACTAEATACTAEATACTAAAATLGCRGQSLLAAVVTFRPPSRFAPTPLPLTTPRASGEGGGGA
eukprot:gene21204-biopygen11651